MRINVTLLRGLFILALTLFVTNVNGQDIKKRFIDAEYHYLYEEFREALPYYLDILKDDPDNANVSYKAAICLLHSNNPKDKEASIPHLTKACKNINLKYKEGSYKERGAPRDAWFYLGNAYRYLHQFDVAIQAYEKYKELIEVSNVFYIDYINREIQCTRNAKDLVRLPVKLETQNLGQKINSPTKVENCPTISNDESTLVFTAGQNNVFSPEIDLNVIDYDYQMDNIYFSVKSEGRWTDPRNITQELGAQTRTVPVTISADGKELYLVRDDNDNGNVYVSYYKNNRWTEMKQLNKHINTSQWESHAALTVDGKTLYFTSDRPGGFGGLDIYKSVRDESGDWGPPVNLGPTINTQYDEETPFILEDSKTMYFSSQGHYSMGGFDVYHTSLISENNWTSPLNVGYPINTVGNDLFYIPKANGEYAFFPLNNNERGIGSNDLFKITVSIPEGVDPEITLKGTITLGDQASELPGDFMISLIDSLRGDTIDQISPNFTERTYAKLVKSGSFKIQYRCTGYETHYEQLFIPEIYTRTEVVIDVEMTPIEVVKGEYYVIKSIFFDYGKHDLRKESMVELERLAQLMLNNPSLYVEIIGHTDAMGSVEFNQKLSERRARGAVDYLTSLGIDQNRFVAKGVGKTQFVAINENPDGSDSPEGRQLNRRVEIKILNTDATNIIVEEIQVPENLQYSKDGRKSQEEHTILLAKQKEKLVTPPGLEVSEIKIDDMYIYTTGMFKSKSDAMKELNKLIDEGFAEATLLSLNDFEAMKKKMNQAYNQAQNNTQSEEAIYTIQLKALTSPTDPSVAFKGIKGVKENFCQDGFYRYTYGEFEGYEAAKAEASKLLMLGYPDAFVVKLDGFESKVETRGEFTIQLKSMKTPVNLSYFKNLKDVKELIGNDGLFKYIYGSFSTVEDARKELKKVQKLGYADAFVVSMAKFK